MGSKGGDVHKRKISFKNAPPKRICVFQFYHLPLKEEIVYFVLSCPGTEANGLDGEQILWAPQFPLCGRQRFPPPCCGRFATTYCCLCADPAGPSTLARVILLYSAYTKRSATYRSRITKNSDVIGIQIQPTKGKKGKFACIQTSSLESDPQ